MISPQSLLDRLPNLDLRSLPREAELAVYMVHNSRDPDDYYFLFDFEEFVDRSNAGLFVCPALRILAGRDDFSRTTFAADFRQVFAAEFDQMRADLAKTKGKRGWLDWGIGLNEIVANLVLAIALSLGRTILSALKLPNPFKGKSAEAKLADEIEDTKRKVETALERIDVTLHPELYEHAYRDGPKGPNARLDREAWPLPDHIRAHLYDGKSGAWW